MFSFFFFQAEDGIRDDLVTGVQTCALPICADTLLPTKNRQREIMRWRLEGAGEALHSPIPWVALTAALALAAAGWIALERSRVDEARSQFERRTETAEAAIRSRMLSYEQILRSGAARIASSPSISRQEWRDFIAHLGLEERFPGIQSIGYASRVKPEEREAHVKRLRAEGLADYEIRPSPER